VAPSATTSASGETIAVLPVRLGVGVVSNIHAHPTSAKHQCADVDVLGARYQVVYANVTLTDGALVCICVNVAPHQVKGSPATALLPMLLHHDKVG
jgi:hypothetical protein